MECYIKINTRQKFVSTIHAQEWIFMSSFTDTNVLTTTEVITVTKLNNKL